MRLRMIMVPGSRRMGSDGDLHLNESWIRGSLYFSPFVSFCLHISYYMKGSLDILWYARWSCKWSFDSLIGDQRSIIVWLLFLRTLDDGRWWSRGPRTGEWICDSRTKANDVLIASVLGAEPGASGWSWKWECRGGGDEGGMGRTGWSRD